MTKEYTWTREYSCEFNIEKFCKKYNLSKNNCGMTTVLECFKDWFAGQDDEIFFSMTGAVMDKIVHDVREYAENL